VDDEQAGFERAERELTDLFHRATEALESEKRLLASGDARADAPPRMPVPEWPDCSAELLQANAQYYPAALFPNTRAAWLKKLVLRVLNIYTYRQILFNAAVVQVLNRWEPALRALGARAGASAQRLAEWLNARIIRLEERRSLWEARLVGRVAALEDRTSAVESDVAAADARTRNDRARIDALEDSVRRLEALLERERAGAGSTR
jgi:hypothetical protein